MKLLGFGRWLSWWGGGHRYEDIDGLVYRIEIDQRLLAVAAGLKVAILILLVISR